MRRRGIKPELLAPGGDLDSIRAAIAAGAGAVYCGLHRFSARSRAANISIEELMGVIAEAHRHDCAIFLTMNIMILEHELSGVVTLLNKLVNSGIDGVIVQDLGLLWLLREHFPTREVHASTQCTVHNRGQLTFLKQLGAQRVNLSRELSMDEVATLTAQAHEIALETEVFVHGSNCISFSGQCLFSSHLRGTSGNRGRCSQPCRDEFQATDRGVSFPFNTKDTSTLSHLAALVDAEVDSLKIEGRIKQFHYVYSTVKAWRDQLETYACTGAHGTRDALLETVFNRELSNAYLSGAVGAEQYVDDPRDGAARKRAAEAEIPLTEAKQQIYDERSVLIAEARAAMATVPVVSQPAPARKRAEAAGKRWVKAVTLPERTWQGNDTTPQLSIVVDSLTAARVAQRFGEVQFQLPNAIDSLYDELLELLKSEAVTPRFPALLLGEQYEAALRLLDALQPAAIVSDNSGLAFAAGERGIPWRAGSAMNMANRYSLTALQERGATGGELSTELSINQLRSLAAPEGFARAYPLYHRPVLMTSRQCLHLQVGGCEKATVDGACLAGCERIDGVTMLDGTALSVEKRAGWFHQLRAPRGVLAEELCEQGAPLFSWMTVDCCAMDAVLLERVLPLFTQVVAGDCAAAQQLRVALNAEASAALGRGI